MKKTLRLFATPAFVALTFSTHEMYPAQAVDQERVADFIGLPKPHSDGRIPTLNNMGWVINSSDPYTADFIKFATVCGKISLEIGAGYGFATIKALKEGARIIANDLDIHHLEILEKNVPFQYKANLELRPGRFPQEICFESESLGAILVSRVFHFFRPQEIEESAKNMFQWLMPGGKVFVIVDSPYLKPWKNFIPIYEQCKKKGITYPGIVSEPCQYNSTSICFLPSYLHFFDPDSLSLPFIKAGFIIEKSDFFKREDYPPHVQLDGKEGVGLIGYKPI